VNETPREAGSESSSGTRREPGGAESAAAPGSEAESLVIEPRRRGGMTIVDVPVAKLVGTDVTERVFGRIHEIAAESPRPLRLVINLEAVGYLSSTSLGHLMALHRKLSASGDSLMLAGLRPRIEDMLALSGITRQIPVYRATEYAIFGLNAAVFSLAAITGISAAVGLLCLGVMIATDWPSGPWRAQTWASMVTMSLLAATIPAPLPVMLLRVWFSQRRPRTQWAVVCLTGLLVAILIGSYLGVLAGT
jgi:anti-anti-sigma factor